MVGVIITGHGHFADGLFSAMGLIAGEQEKVKVVNFLDGDSLENLKNHLKQAAEALGGEKLVFLADIAGGSPYNQAVLLQKELPQACRVFSGTNMPFLLSVIFDREENLDELEKRWLSPEINVTAFHEKKKKVQAQAGGI